ncbi:MAG: hypothetical protein ACRC2T_20765 [Thermoguttaceae bacterium]
MAWLFSDTNYAYSVGHPNDYLCGNHKLAAAFTIAGPYIFNIMKNNYDATPYQERLVKIGIFIQFYLAAIVHVITWLFMVYLLYCMKSDPGHSYRSGAFLEAIVYAGLPISFGVLVVLYILFRLLFRFLHFSGALEIIITLNIIHATIMMMLIITPLRLLVPTILYILAYRDCLKNDAAINNMNNTEISEKNVD